MQGVICNQCSRLDDFSAWEKAARDNPDVFTKPSDYICPRYGQIIVYKITRVIIVSTGVLDNKLMKLIIKDVAYMNICILILAKNYILCLY